MYAVNTHSFILFGPTPRAHVTPCMNTINFRMWVHVYDSGDNANDLGRCVRVRACTVRFSHRFTPDLISHRPTIITTLSVFNNTIKIQYTSYYEPTVRNGKSARSSRRFEIDFSEETTPRSHDACGCNNNNIMRVCAYIDWILSKTSIIIVKFFKRNDIAYQTAVRSTIYRQRSPWSVELGDYNRFCRNTWILAKKKKWFYGSPCPLECIAVRRRTCTRVQAYGVRRLQTTTSVALWVAMLRKGGTVPPSPRNFPFHELRKYGQISEKKRIATIST